ncbi:hypothetical protein K466DRAFT_58216 [Polyporus arcularius HHB13444]|uniref:Uncharacterized protein n=1 Tax=Polyporus arcularius HHB13444 TaxID=1314778 RepID=A0A5C3PGN7_9APHY|nr:hypothetical protein K466DRAFT_58216 [Polyporus arcularius HHB13444]
MFVTHASLQPPRCAELYVSWYRPGRSRLSDVLVRPVSQAEAYSEYEGMRSLRSQTRCPLDGHVSLLLSVLLLSTPRSPDLRPRLPPAIEDGRSRNRLFFYEPRADTGTRRSHARVFLQGESFHGVYQFART